METATTSAVTSIDYTKVEVPPTYTCGKCGATNCKMWHDHLIHKMLLCVLCAAENQKKDVTSIDETGMRLSDIGNDRRTDQIGWCVPAIPTNYPGVYWGYGSVPIEAMTWWKRLPTHQVTRQRAQVLIDHAKWRLSRGKQPSGGLGTVRNPRLALVLATQIVASKS